MTVPALPRLFSTRSNGFMRALSARSVRLVPVILLGFCPPHAIGEDGGRANAYEPLQPLEAHGKTSENIVNQLSSHHYVNKKVNDALSSEIFDHFLEMLDSSRTYFLASDIASFEQYRYTLDDALDAGDIGPGFKIFNRYEKRLVERLQYSIALLEQGVSNFDFTLDESVSVDRESAPWLADRSAQRDLWRRRVKADVLGMKLNDKEAEKIQKVLLNRYENRLNRVAQTKPEDAFQLYMNAVAGVYDPHTQYFSPRTSENFNINMSLSLEGIGAVLRAEDEHTSVVRLVPAGPADKSGKLHPSDHIIAVGQGREGTMKDVVGWRLDDVVDLIRGEAGSVVRLEVIAGSDNATNAQPRTIVLTREAVKLEEQSAQSRVIEIQRPDGAHRIGVIDIPTFYIDFEAMRSGDPDYKSTTRDVRKLIAKLKKQNIEGLVIDLRNNGGGSLQEANSLTGLFVPPGPTVQIRSANNRVDILDSKVDIAWHGPLAVMVNRLSASASEIFAGAIQDYQRGLVLGSQTFGKGTVQTLVPLNRGQLKMTQAKFYRVTGQSTQHQGIIPDIEYPQVYDHDEIGESALDGALHWDVIRPARFNRANSLTPVISKLDDRHDARVDDDAEFSYLRTLLQHMREREDKQRISLNLSKRRKEQADQEAWRLALENKRRKALGKPPVESLDALEDGASGPPVAATGRGPPPLSAADPEDAGESTPENPDDTDSGEAGQQAAEDSDALLEESANILLDYAALPGDLADLEDAPYANAH